jgi:hypothetical protein
MWPYWALFFVPAAIALSRPGDGVDAAARREHLPASWWLLILLLTMMLGLRVEVGADWETYIYHLYLAQTSTIGELLSGRDPAYELLNYFSGDLGFDIFGTNVVCAFLFAIGLAVFCLQQPRPWLALTVAMPYLVIVVGMGYTRQAVAVGLAMLGLSALEKKQMVWFAFWVLLAASFHKSAVLLFPIAALASTRNRIWTALWIGLVTIGAYYLFLEESIDHLQYVYLEREYQSEGALVRLLMNAVPAVLLLTQWSSFRQLTPAASLWRWLAILAFALLGALVLSPSSTAVDRIALYVIPLQLVVFARLPEMLTRTRQSKKTIVILIVFYSAATLLVWLNMSTHSSAWIPYRFHPFEVLL